MQKMIFSRQILKKLKTYSFSPATTFKVSHLKTFDSKNSNMFEFDKEIIKSETNSNLDFPYDINGFQIILPTKVLFYFIIILFFVFTF